MSEKKMQNCAACGIKFNQKAIGRIRITKKIEKGEEVRWICPKCGVKI